MQNCARAASQILDNYQQQSCVFAGLSWSGFVAQAFHKEYSSRCDGVILMNTCTAPPSGQEKVMFSIIPKLLAWLGPLHLKSALTKALLSPDSINHNPALVDRLSASLEVLDYPNMTAVFKSVMKGRDDLEYCLAETSGNFLVIYGAQDASMDQSRTDHMISLLPQETTTVLRLEVGHNAVLEASDEVLRAMQNFLEPQHASQGST